MPARYWGKALNQFAIIYGDRVAPMNNNKNHLHKLSDTLFIRTLT